MKKSLENNINSLSAIIPYSLGSVLTFSFQIIQIE